MLYLTPKRDNTRTTNQIKGFMYTWAGFANFIDEWSQCDFRFTKFGAILEYLESSITMENGPGMYTLSWGIDKVAVVVRWPGKL